MDRRGFLKTWLAAAGAAAAFSAGGRPVMGAETPAPEKPKEDKAAPEKPRKEAVLKLCSQDGRVPGKSLKEKVDNLLKWGGVGIEFGGLDLSRAKQLKAELAGSGIGVAALCSGYFPLIDPDEAKRKQGVEGIKKQLDAAAEIGSTGVIVVPAFNGHAQLPFDEGRKVLVDLCPAIGEYAKKVGNRILFEPLNKGEARFFNRLEQAAGVCRDSKAEGICMMGDFYHMCKEEKDDEAAFITAGPYLHHVHLASRARNLPGQDDRSFVAGFRGLKKIGYQDYCSLECGVRGDPVVEIPKSFELLKKQWQEAVI